MTPAYPELARKMNLTGTARIEVIIGPDGTVKHTRVLGGHPVLAAEAERAAEKSTFEPAPPKPPKSSNLSSNRSRVSARRVFVARWRFAGSRRNREPRGQSSLADSVMTAPPPQRREGLQPQDTLHPPHKKPPKKVGAQHAAPQVRKF